MTAKVGGLYIRPRPNTSNQSYNESEICIIVDRVDDDNTVYAKRFRKLPDGVGQCGIFFRPGEFEETDYREVVI